MCCFKVEIEVSLDCDVFLFVRIEIFLLVILKLLGDKFDVDCCFFIFLCGGKILCDIVNFIFIIILMFICFLFFGRKYRKRKIIFEFIYKNVYVEVIWILGFGVRF